MQPSPGEDAAVERVFELTGPDGVAEVRLALGPPEPDPRPDGDPRCPDWRCRVRIAGLARPVDQHAYGIDALQALALGCEMARSYLETAPLAAGQALTWLGQADLGLPRVLPARGAA